MTNPHTVFKIAMTTNKDNQPDSTIQILSVTLQGHLVCPRKIQEHRRFLYAEYTQNIRRIYAEYRQNIRRMHIIYSIF